MCRKKVSVWVGCVATLVEYGEPMDVTICATLALMVVAKLALVKFLFEPVCVIVTWMPLGVDMMLATFTEAP